MGQYIQDGERHLFETVLAVEESKSDIVVKEDSENVDGLNYLAGKGLDYINKKAMEGTIEAHVSGNVPNLNERLDSNSELNDLVKFLVGNIKVKSSHGGLFSFLRRKK